MKQELIDLIPPTISLIITSSIAILIGILIEKYKNRFFAFEYNISSQKIIPSVSRTLIGNLSIKLRDREINTLKVVEIEIENNNNFDFENILLSIDLGHNSYFQSEESYTSFSKQQVLWSENYRINFNNVLDEFNSSPNSVENPTLKDVSEELQNRINYVLAHKEYFIPAFNRKESIVFNFLIEDPIDGTEASIYPYVNHKSIKLVKKKDFEKQKNSDLWKSITIGTTLCFVAILALTYYFPNSDTVIVVAAIIGYTYSIIGHFILFVYKRLKDFFI